MSHTYKHAPGFGMRIACIESDMQMCMSFTFTDVFSLDVPTALPETVICVCLCLQEATNSKSRGRPPKIAAKVSSEPACGLPTLAVKKSSRSMKAPKGSFVASKRDSDEVEGLDGGPPPTIKVEQESQVPEICKRSPRSFDLNLDPKVEGEDFGHEDSGLGEVLEPKDLTLPKSEVVGLGDLGGGQPICSYVELSTSLVSNLKPSVEEDDDYDCDD